jgi:hypothetical protein
VDEDQKTLLTRRRLLATGAVAAAAVTLPDTSASAKLYKAAASKVKPLPRFTRTGWRRSRFEPHLGAPVKLRPLGGAAVRGQLVGVEDVANVTGLAGHQDAYTLRFRAPAALPLAAGVVGVRNNQFGVVELYMTPVPAQGANQDYLAVINRRVSRSALRSRPR